MAIIKQGSPLQGASGRLGNVVTYELNGVQVIRSLPGTTKRKPTNRQSAHRESFAIQHKIARSLKWNIIYRIWNQFSYKGGMNAYNRFIQVNRQAYGSKGYIDFPELMIVSQGNLSPVNNLKVSLEGDHLLFQWTTGVRSRINSDSDQLNVVLLHSRSSLQVIETATQCKAGQTIIPLSGAIKENPEGYVFWSSIDNRSFSPSVYWRCS
jgi:hypothetical protein